jgi:hypothetical protein
MTLRNFYSVMRRLTADGLKMSRHGGAKAIL